MLRDDSKVVCWGAGAAGARGFPNSGQSAAPNAAFVMVSAGEAHTCGMSADGYVRCWGSDAGGRATPSLTFAAAEQLGEQLGRRLGGGHQLAVLERLGVVGQPLPLRKLLRRFDKPPRRRWTIGL